MLCINCIKYKHGGSFRSWRHRIFYWFYEEINLDQPDMPASLPGLVPVSLPVPQEVFPEFGSLDFSEAEQMIDDKKKVPKIFQNFFQNWWIIHFLFFVQGRLCHPACISTVLSQGRALAHCWVTVWAWISTKSELADGSWRPRLRKTTKL